MRTNRIVPWIAVVLAVAALGLTAAASYAAPNPLTHIGQPPSKIKNITVSNTAGQGGTWTWEDGDTPFTLPVGYVLVITDINFLALTSYKPQYMSIFPHGYGVLALIVASTTELGVCAGTLNMTTGIVLDSKKIKNFQAEIFQGGVSCPGVKWVYFKGYLVPDDTKPTRTPAPTPE